MSAITVPLWVMPSMPTLKCVPSFGAISLTLATVAFAVPEIVTPEAVKPVTGSLKIAVKLITVLALGPVTGSACPTA